MSGATNSLGFTASRAGRPGNQLDANADRSTRVDSLTYTTPCCSVQGYDGCPAPIPVRRPAPIGDCAQEREGCQDGGGSLRGGGPLLRVRRPSVPRS
eukprot:1501453-Pyramimonas_sp.AAC.1